MRVAKNTQYIEEKTIQYISNKIKKIRKERGYSSYENFAIDNNIDRKQYWRIETGQNLTIKTLIKVLNLLDISFSEFFKDLK